jgi:hypothetical protein
MTDNDFAATEGTPHGTTHNFSISVSTHLLNNQSPEMTLKNKWMMEGSGGGCGEASK